MRIQNPIRFDAREWTGAFGDIGVLIPILLSLAVINGIDLARALAVAGAAYIASGLYFRLPVPIQPLKAMAAIALAQGLGLNVIRAGSIWMGIILIVVAWGGGIEVVSRFFPRVIVKGLQLGVGLLLIKSAWKMFLPAMPHALPILRAAPTLVPKDFLISFFVLVVPQIPLTLGNAVFGASDALNVYYGKRAEYATPKRLTVSIGLINIVAGALNGYPLCHGSGGVTAHARTGARTAGATIIMGSACLVLAFIIGQNSYSLLSGIPHCVLGILLLYAGAFHSGLFLQLEQRNDQAIAIVMGALAVYTNHLDWALGAGLALYILTKAVVRVRWRAIIQ